MSVEGSIDWLCMPRFDSPSVFAAILDDAKGGFFRIRPANAEASNYKQFYWPDTNVLVTAHRTRTTHPTIARAEPTKIPAAVFRSLLAGRR